jgi:hypothetical protein
MKIPGRILRKKIRMIKQQAYRKARKDFLAELDHLIGKHEDALKDTREKERAYYKPIISDLEGEIQRLNTLLARKRKTYGQVRDTGYAIEEITEEVSELFTRGHGKVTEGMQLINRARDKIEYHNLLVDKRNGKIIKGLTGVKS